MKKVERETHTREAILHHNIPPFSFSSMGKIEHAQTQDTHSNTFSSFSSHSELDLLLLSAQENCSLSALKSSYNFFITVDSIFGKAQSLTKRSSSPQTAFNDTHTHMHTHLYDRQLAPVFLVSLPYLLQFPMQCHPPNRPHLYEMFD